MATEVTIDKARITQLANNAGWVQLLPLLGRVANKVTGKSCCGRQSVSRPTKVALDDALRDLTNLLSNDRGLVAQVKAKLGATSLRVKYTMAGKTMESVKKF